ncbi:glycosyltransferase family 4 protein [Rhizobium sp. A37_96]
MFDTINLLIEALCRRKYRRLVLASGLFDAEWYKLAYPYVVRDGIDPLTHFLQNGKKHRLSPSAIFDTSRYLDEHDTARLSRLNPLVHYLMQGRQQSLEIHSPPLNAAGRIRTSGLFDDNWYGARYPDVADSGLSPLLHYLIYGASQGHSPGPDFDSEWYLSHYPDIVGIDPLLHFIDHGRGEGRSPLRPTRIMELAIRTVKSVEDIEPELYAADYFANMDHIAVLDGRPRHSVARVFEAVIDAIREPPRAIVFMPWLIHGGADLVACHAIRALAETYSATSVLVILTDADREEALHLLPENVPLLSLSRIDADLSPSERTELIDLILRSLQPDAVLNVNSRACWQAVKVYGRRLSFFTRLYAMLFCPDFSESGRRNGYSDLYLRQCLPHLSGIYFDNQSYIDELTEHFCIPAELRSRLVVLYQPAPSILSVKHGRRPEEPLRVLWAGRLAQQKNPSLLMAIVERAPRFEFHIWGRGDSTWRQQLVALSQRCANVYFQGPFDRFDGLPLADYDVLLYTSLWDGIPNILLEASAARLPIVASHVGGIGELVDAQTGWLIGEPDDPESYVAALQAIADDPVEAVRRSEAMRGKLLRDHAWSAYRQVLTLQPRSTGGLLNGSSPNYGNSDGASRGIVGEAIA